MVKYIKDEWERLAIMARFDCKELAKLNKLSVRQLQRVFHNTFGRTPQDWLNERRILTAQQLLRNGSSIKGVAIDLGFKQSSHFCRQFKIVCGITPSQFKDHVACTANVVQG
jgi:AraC-like DNA-binding protein